ncbi:hypothetical protein FQN54_005171 [Arachnomyces sp. PD_36]|nr:hypothetical protein FQN54_005171 [Arachnomyces sp. PD_36]
MATQQADGESTGPRLQELEKELICSICTDLLYQPLTVLDCLHTFCGSCLQEWFSWQVSQPRSGRTPRFTCPSCRATVRETRPNATVTTLLDMFLQANPNRMKPAEEREEIAKKYKPGNSVLPVRDAEQGDSESDEEDRRLVDEVRAMSLREAGTGTSRQSSAGGARSSRDHRGRDRADRAGESDHESRRRGQGERRRRPETQQDASTSGARAGRESASVSARQIEHQSSLRSLLSASDGESPLEEQILRQIVEEGLLDDIDLRNLNQAQEDELTERIAEAYRRRHRERSPARQRTRSDASERPRTSGRRVRSQSAQTRAVEPVRQHPPVSRPHLLETPPTSQTTRHQRSASDQGSRRQRPSTSPINRPQVSDVALPSTVRTNSDTTSRPRSSRSSRSASVQREPLTSRIPRSSGEPDIRVPDSPISGRERGSRPSDRRLIDSPTLRPAATVPIPHSPSPNRTGRSSTQVDSSRNELREPSNRSNRAPSSRTSPARPEPPRIGPTLFPEPSIFCDRCGTQEIQYGLHKSCSRCNDGKYNICLRCYRLGRGCLHWFGFGSSAQVRFEKAFPRPSVGNDTPPREPPHVLTSRKYRRPPSGATEQIVEGRGKMTSDNPANRLLTGMFCDMCLSFSDEWFWKCGRCNEGEWGFCNRCVNQNRCCTHPLLPITRISNEEAQTQPNNPLNQEPTSSQLQPAPAIPQGYQQLTFSTKCDICTYPIPPSTTRFHCPECSDGDYNICTNCYNKLVSSRKISQEHGPKGWRRCLRGHRMIVVGFVDHEDGQRRVVVKELVGGHALKDDHPTTSPSSAVVAGTSSSPDPATGDWSWKDGPDGSRTKTIRARNPWASTTSLALSPTVATFDAAATADSPTTSQFPPPPIPPSGGIGLRLLALWSYYPDPDDVDELSFPRGAEITEGENINDDWFWGCYAGNKGLFPGAYGRVLGEV